MPRAWLPLLLSSVLAGGEAVLPSLTSTVIAGEVLHANTVELSGMVFRDVTARPSFANGVLGFLDLEAKAYRGRILGWYAIDLSPAHRGHRCEFKITGVDLATLARSLGTTNELLGGIVEGWFEATLPIGGGKGVAGRGQIDINDGTLAPALAQLPLLVDFLVGNPFATRGKDRLSARFRLDDQGIEVLWLRLESPTIRLAAQGRIGYDGRLQIELSPRLPFELWSRIPLVGWAAQGLSHLTSRTRIYVRGHVTQAVVVFNAFTG